MITLEHDEANALTDIMSKYSLSFFIEKVFYEIEADIPFVYGKHIDAICDYLEALRNGDIYGINIVIPPRSLKSIICSIAFPLFLLGHDPATRIFGVSYAQNIAEGFSMRSRDIMLKPWYQKMFPNTILKQNPNRNDYFETTHGGFRKSYAIGSSSVTGDGAHYLILDDPLPPMNARSDAERRNTLEYIKNTLLSRGASGKRLKVLNVMQRTHQDDVVAMFKSNKNFITLELPAEFRQDVTITTSKRSILYNKGDVLQPDLYKNDPQCPQGYKSFLDAQKKEMGEWNYACQYLLSPAPLEGGLVQKSSLKWYDNDTKPTHFPLVIHSWDTAFTVTTSSAYSACTIWGVTVRGLYLLQVINERLDSTDLDQKVRKLADRDKPYRILIENKASGIGLIQRLQRTTTLPIQSINVSGSNKNSAEANPKVERFTFAKNYIDTGKVYLPTSAFWLDDYLQQILTFPNSAFADMVDSTSQFCKWFHENERYLLDLISEPEYLYNNFDELSDSNIRETHNYTGY